MVLVVLFRDAIRRDSVYLERFLFLSHVHVFSCEILVYLFLLHVSFWFQFSQVIFNWSIRDSKSLQASRTRLSILVLLMIFSSYSFFSMPLQIVSKTPTIIGMNFTIMFHLPSWLKPYNTPTASLQRSKNPHSTSVLVMTLNNWMVKFQWCWSFGKYRVLLHCHRSRIHSDPEG